MKLAIVVLLAIANLTLAQNNTTTVRSTTTTTGPNNPRVNTPNRREIAIQCGKENGADPAELAKPNVIFRKLFKGHAYRCWSTCFYIKLEYVNDKGEGNAKNLKVRYNVSDDAKLAETIKTCSAANWNRKDTCDKVHATMVCLHSALKQ